MSSKKYNKTSFALLTENNEIMTINLIMTAIKGREHNMTREEVKTPF
jgi:hypothetical protein